MAQPPILINMPSEILGFIYSYLPSEDLLNLPTKLLFKGLTKAIATEQLQTFSFTLNDEGVKKFDQLSRMYRGVKDIVRNVCVYIDYIEDETDYFQKLSLRRHLTEYHGTRPASKITTIRGLHTSLAIQDRNSCRVCAGRSVPQLKEDMMRCAAVPKSSQSVHLVTNALKRLSEICLTAIERKYTGRSDQRRYMRTKRIAGEAGDKLYRLKLPDILFRALALSGFTAAPGAFYKGLRMITSYESSQDMDPDGFWLLIFLRHDKQKINKVDSNSTTIFKRLDPNTYDDSCRNLRTGLDHLCFYPTDQDIEHLLNARLSKYGVHRRLPTEELNRSLDEVVPLSG